MTLKRLARTGRAALRGGAGIVGVRCEGQSPFVVERLSMRALARCAVAHSNKSILFPCTREGGSTHAPTARMLKSAAWGVLGGELHGEKLLKAGGLVFFFKLQKPGLMGLCNQSAINLASNLHSVLRGKPWLPLSGCRGALA